MEINNRPDSIEFGSRDGFFIVGIGFPIIYIGLIIEQFNPALIKKYKQFLNYAAITLVVVLLGAGFWSSSLIKTKVEKAGYTYCRNASGISALARTLVYTKDMAICEKQVALKTKRH